MDNCRFGMTPTGPAQRTWYEVDVVRLRNEEDRIIQDLIRETEAQVAAGQFFEACAGVCHEGVQVHDIVGWNGPDGYVRFGFCSADVRLPLSALPFTITDANWGDTAGRLYNMEPEEWPDVMKAAMKPLAEHALRIYREGGMGC